MIREEAEKRLRAVFGLERFHERQWEVIERVSVAMEGFEGGAGALDREDRLWQITLLPVSSNTNGWTYHRIFAVDRVDA